MDIRRWHITDIYYLAGEQEKAKKHADNLVKNYGWTMGDDDEAIEPYEGCIQLHKLDKPKYFRR